MADFTGPFWSIFITVVTVASIVALIILFVRFTGGKATGVDGEPDTTGHVWDEDLREYNNPMPRWWLNLFYITLIFSIIYLALYPGLGAFGGILGWSQIKQYEEEIQAAERNYGPLFNRHLNEDLATLADNPEALEVGRRLFSNYCSTCHGSDARGARGFPNLRDDDWLYGGDPETIKTSILDGRSGLMPGWKDIISEQDIDDITHHVLSFSDRLFDPAAAARGKPIYDSYCAVCHAENGTGNPAFGAPNLADDIWLHGASKQRIIEGIGAGFENVMPPTRRSWARPSHTCWPLMSTACPGRGYVCAVRRIITFRKTGKSLSTGSARHVCPAPGRRCTRPAGVVLHAALGAMVGPAGRAAGPAGAKISPVWPHPVAPGLSPAHLAADYRRHVPVFFHRVGRQVVVRLCLPPDRMDGSVFMDRTPYRREPHPADAAGPGFSQLHESQD